VKNHYKKILALLFFLNALVVSDVFASWTIEIIDSTGNVGKYNSITVDSSNKIHISYYDATNKVLKYITNASGPWASETVDSNINGEVGKHTSIAIDLLDKVHISYYYPCYSCGSQRQNLHYATNTSGYWGTTLVDGNYSLSVGTGNSIAIDSSSHVHISYNDYTNNTLKYATNKTGSWMTTTITSSGPVKPPKLTSIAVDSSDNIHICFYDTTSRDLKYATNKTGSWTVEIVDSTNDDGKYCSIAIDSLDNIHISYHEGSPNYDLKYATNASGSWDIQTVDSAGPTGEYTSIALDSQDKAHISYISNGDELKYATNTTGSWVSGVIDSGIGKVNGSNTSIAVDKLDNVHISYYDSINGDLKYTTNAPVPDIKANGFDDPVTIRTNDTLSITIALACGEHCGEQADWWVVTNTPMGWYHYDAKVNSWKPNLSCSYQNSLVNLPDHEVLNMSNLPTGYYTFYFGIDTDMNCSLNRDQLHYDEVRVDISP
jgi:hypothetical protein